MSFVTNYLNKVIKKREEEIISWFKVNFGNKIPCLYNSVDLRHSGKKMAPVDTNIYPAGFNNLGDRGKKRAIEAFKNYIELYHDNAKRIIIVPENHSRNLFYLENLRILRDLIVASGREVVIGSLENDNEVDTHSGQKVNMQGLKREGNKLIANNGFVTDIVVLNNDLTNDIPPILKDIIQPIVPSTKFGWYKRRKSKHFEAYNNLAAKFCSDFNIDPFYITTLNSKCNMIDFKEKKGLDQLAETVDNMLNVLKENYKKYEVDNEPYLFIKADNGTYGMGIMIARSGEDVLNINKKVRNKMDIIKEGVQNTEVLIQEGIPTVDIIDGKNAEPMIYIVGGEPIDCIFRVNSERDAFGNLNAKGMYFEQNICEESLALNAIKDKANPDSCHITAHKLIAKLAAYACTLEN